MVKVTMVEMINPNLAKMYYIGNIGVSVAIANLLAVDHRANSGLCLTPLNFLQRNTIIM